MERVAKWLLYAQLALTVAALVLVGVALTSDTTTTSGGIVIRGTMVSTPVILCGVLLIAAGILGLVALRRHSMYLRAGLILLAPLIVAVGSSLPSESDARTQVLLGEDTFGPIEETLRLLSWSASLVFGALLGAAVSGVLLLQLKRRQTP
jgi:hypothetical protein